ncbi:MAG: UPF0271 protein [Oleiphilaceae bacterium]|jgi:UPF0271 protein
MLLNCDLGESYGYWHIAADPLVMPHIDMANIACGYHAGDPQVMQKTIALAKQYQVKIGAHPSYPDRQGFGRRSMHLVHDEIESLIIYQLGALVGMCKSQGCQVSYLKPHGALYNDMMKNNEVLNAIFSAMQKYDQGMPLLMMATSHNSRFKQTAKKYGINVMFEAFADRAYDDEGYLVPRNIEGAVLKNPDDILSRATQLKTQGTIQSIDGKTMRIDAETLCVHGDNEQAVQMIQSLKQCLSV